MPRPLSSSPTPRSIRRVSSLSSHALEDAGQMLPAAMENAHVARRGVLLGLAGSLALVVSGCNSSTSSPGASGAGVPSQSDSAASTSPASPTPSSSSPSSPTSPTSTHSAPSVDWSSVRTQLQTSVSLFAGASAAGLKDATPAFRSWAAAGATMSAQQAARLALSDPLSGASATPAAPAPTKLASMADAAKRLSTQQQALSAHCVQLAGQAGNADEALLLVSLAAAAHATTALGPAVTASTLPPTHADLGSRTDAQQVLLSHLEATVEGYERGAGRLAANDAKGLASARARLDQLSALRDATESALASAGATPAPPVLGYAMPGGFGSAAAIHQTWAHLELSLLDAWARVAAASTGRDRADAITQVMAQVDAARGLGMAPTTWPGWTAG